MPTKIEGSEHFTFEEFLCRCGKCRWSKVETLNAIEKSAITRLAVKVLEPIRAKLGYPMVITRGISCPEHNHAIGGKDFDPQKPDSGSRHLPQFAAKGVAAADVVTSKGTPQDVANAAAASPETGGIGLYSNKTCCHLDTRARIGGQITRWFE